MSTPVGGCELTSAEGQVGPWIPPTWGLILLSSWSWAPFPIPGLYPFGSSHNLDYARLGLLEDRELVLCSNLGSFLQEIETYLVVLSKGSFDIMGCLLGGGGAPEMDGKPYNQPWEWVETRTTQGEAEEAGRTDAFLQLRQPGQEATITPLRCWSYNEAPTSLLTSLWCDDLRFRSWKTGSDWLSRAGRARIWSLGFQSGRLVLESLSENTHGGRAGFPKEIWRVLRERA